jgi:hypothetical protein
MNKAVLRQAAGSAGCARNILPAVELLLAGILVAALLVPGCSSGGPSTGRSSPFGRSSPDERLSKQVQADPFPTAQQAGLK